MPVTAQSSSRFTRVERASQPAWGAAQEAAIAVLYLPSATRDRSTLRDRMARAGAMVSVCNTLPDAVQMLGTRPFGLVVVDLAGERAARAAIRHIHAHFPDTPVVGVVDPAQSLTPAGSIEGDPVHLLPWPVEEIDIAAMLATARDAAPADLSPGFVEVEERLYHQSPAMRPVMDAIKSAAGRRTGVLVSGESGSGRGLVARTIHERDHDYINRPFVIIDCRNQPSNLERELFGVAADRQGDADAEAQGESAARGSAVLAAQGGSLFLTHVQDAPLHVQDRLARLLRQQRMFSVDAQETVPVAFRAMASAGPDVDVARADGRLSPALAAELGRIQIDVPPLRQRREDLSELVSHFVRHASANAAPRQKQFSRAALTLLAALPWPGNGRELRNVVLAAAAQTSGSIIQIDAVLAHVALAGGPPAISAKGVTLRDARARFERDCISATLVRHHGSVGDAAKALGIQRTNLYRKVRQLNVPRALLSPQK